MSVFIVIDHSHPTCLGTSSPFQFQHLHVWTSPSPSSNIPSTTLSSSTSSPIPNHQQLLLETLQTPTSRSSERPKRRKTPSPPPTNKFIVDI